MSDPTNGTSASGSAGSPGIVIPDTSAPTSEPISSSLPIPPHVDAASYYVPPPMRDLPIDVTSPFYSDRDIHTAGDVIEALTRWVRSSLRNPVDGTGAQFIMFDIYSFPGVIEPDHPISRWDPYHQALPCFCVVGDFREILWRLAPQMGWDGVSIESIIEKSQPQETKKILGRTFINRYTGEPITFKIIRNVYHHSELQTRDGPIPFSIKIWDPKIWKVFHPEVDKFKRERLKAYPHPNFENSFLTIASEGFYRVIGESGDAFRDYFSEQSEEDSAKYLREKREALSSFWRESPRLQVQARQYTFEASFASRDQHAAKLPEAFEAWWRPLRNTEVAPEEASRGQTPSEAETYVLRRLSLDPEHYRGLVLEWGFDRIENALKKEAAKDFAGKPEKVESVQREIGEYFERSILLEQDTPLRRILGGFKAVDVMRRYQTHLAPEEVRGVFPHLVSALDLAQGTAREHGLAGRTSHFSRWLNHAQRTADRMFVDHVGESAPLYRSRGWAKRFYDHTNLRPAVLMDGTIGMQRVDGAALVPEEVQLLTRRYGFLPSRIPHLMAAAAGADSSETLSNISEQRMTTRRLLQWLNTAEGKAHLEKHGHLYKDSFANRKWEMGPGLVAGLGSLYLFEQAADGLGLDPVRNSHERFMLVASGAHWVNKGFGSFSEVFVNRQILGAPFDFAPMRQVQAGATWAYQPVFEKRASWTQAFRDSFVRQNYGMFYGSLKNRAIHGVKATLKFPITTGWNMGAGLMSAALTDHFVSEGLLGLEQGSTARNMIHTGSFFLPDTLKMFGGERYTAWGRIRPVRWASRAFSLGFMADMGFTLANRLHYGADATYESAVNQLANELHDEAEGSGVIDGALELMAPQLAAWWDAKDYKSQARSQLIENRRAIEGNAHSTLQRQLLEGVGDESDQLDFYTKVDWAPWQQAEEATVSRQGKKLPVELLEKDLCDPAFYKRLMSASPRAQARILQRRYSGYSLTPSDAEALLATVERRDVKSGLAQLHQLPGRKLSPFQIYFDKQGQLNPGMEEGLLGEVFGTPDFQESDLLTQRRANLALRLLKARELGEEEEVQRLENLAKQVGLVSDTGEWERGASDPALQIAQSEFASWSQERASQPRTYSI